TMPTRDMPIMDKNNGGTAVGYSATIAKAAAVSGVDIIINGHNAATTTPADLKLYSEFIADFVKFAQDAKKKRQDRGRCGEQLESACEVHRLRHPEPCARQG
ncbi:MAG: hypothetical protein DMF94_22255, partial [Acidobacteria bacterium]